MKTKQERYVFLKNARISFLERPRYRSRIRYVIADSQGKLYHYRLLSTFLSFFTGIAVSFKKHLRRLCIYSFIVRKLYSLL